ncbi:MAG: oligosaccharide flippase family protein, partial [Candidatus Hadarchaeum sp.]
MRSIFALVLRHGALRVIGLAGNICLARLLVPEAFGIFATASFIIDFFKFFGDVGLGAALIQKEEVEEEDFRTTFTLQQMLIVTLAAICFLIAPTVSSHYELGRSGEWLLRVLSVSLFLSSLRSIPSIILQRQLHFEKLAFAEVLENISYWGLAVGLAALGYEVWSLVYATLGRHIVSLIVVYWMIPWRPSLGFHRSAAGRLLRFGAPYQLNGFLWMMQNAIAPIWVGTVCGSQALGFLTWAKQVAFLPLPFLNIVENVTFPAFSRIQHDSERLGAYIEKCIRLVSIILFPLICLIVATSIDLIHFVYTD